MADLPKMALETVRAGAKAQIVVVSLRPDQKSSTRAWSGGDLQGSAVSLEGQQRAGSAQPIYFFGRFSGVEGSAKRRSNSCTSASWPAVRILPSAERSIASQLDRKTSSASKSGFISFTPSSCILMSASEILQRMPMLPVGGKGLTRISHLDRYFRVTTQQR